MIKAVIFDFFGVLVGAGFHETYRELGGDPAKDREFIEELMDKTNSGQISYQQYKETLTRRLGITLEEYDEAVASAERPNFRVLNYAASLRKKYKTAILSNADVGVLDRKLSKEWVDKCFDITVVSADVGMIKPDPRIYELTARKLGVQPEECVFIDDRSNYVEGAKAVGMHVVWFRDFDQAKKELEKILAAGSND